MEKYILVLPSVLLLVVFLNLNAVVAQTYPPVMEECKVAEKATDDDMMNLRNPNQPRTMAMKCVLTCMGEKSGKIVSNKLSADGVMKFAKASPQYTEQLGQSVTEIITECQSVTDPDRCEAGFKIMECMMDGAKKRGIKGALYGQHKP